MLIDGRGVPLGAAVEGANVHDQKLVKATLNSIPVPRPKPSLRKPLEERSFCILHQVNKLLDQGLLPSFDLPSRRNHVEEVRSVDFRKRHLPP